MERREAIGSRIVAIAAAALLALLAGCVGQIGPPGPRYAEVAAQIPTLATGRARFFFYRDWEPYETLGQPYLYLNGQRVGISIPGGVFYRDMPPGQYLISVDTVGVYWNPFKTVTVAAGETRYVKIESRSDWESGFDTYEADTFVVVLIDATQARRELDGMRFVTGE